MSMSVYLVLMNQKVMKHVIKLLQEVIQLPLQIDSSNFQAIEEACRYYKWKTAY